MRLLPVAVLALALLLASPAVAAGPASVHPSPSPTAASTIDGAAAESTAAETPERADPWQVIRIGVTADGDAEWTVESRYALESESDAERFQNFSQAVADGDEDVDFDLEAVERFADRAAEDTGREMSIEDTGWGEPRIEPADETPSPENDTVGVISRTFTWENFAETDWTWVYLGDALHADGEPLFASLEDGQRLVIEPPENYNYEEFPASATQNEERALVWEGPEDFDDGELQVTYSERADTVEDYALTVTVEDEEGVPIENATVALEGIDGEPTAGTDADGRVTFQDLPDGEYTIVVEHDDAELEETVTIDGADETVDLTLRATYELSATVEDEEGTPIANATVTLEGPDGEELTAETDADGRISFQDLPDGEYAIVVEHDGAELEETVTIDGADETVSLALALPDEDHALTATVEDEEGTPIANATVTLEGPDGEERTAETDADGRISFEGLSDGEYTIVVEHDGAELEETVTIDGDDETVTLTSDAGGGDGASLLLTALGLVGAIALLGATTYVLGKRREADADADDAPAAAAAEPDAIEPPTVAYDEETLEKTDVEEEIDVELLSDEERVLRLLRKNNGRMKQASIVSETGWSDAKVSQLLSKMADDDDIEKLRIGRENLITLPEVDPTAID